MKPLTTFAEYLRTTREEAGMSLRALARALEISHTSVRAVECGLQAVLTPKHWGCLVEALPELRWDELQLRYRCHRLQKIGYSRDYASKLAYFAKALDCKDQDQRLRETLEIIGELP